MIANLLKNFLKYYQELGFLNSCKEAIIAGLYTIPLDGDIKISISVMMVISKATLLKKRRN